MAKKNNGGHNMAMGVGMLAAVAAGAYYLYGTKEGAKKRVKVQGWALKAKGEMLEKLENLKEVNEVRYNELVDGVMKKYQGLKNLDQTEVAIVLADLKKHWKSIKKHLDAGNKTKAPAKKRTTKTAVKK